VQSFIVLVGTFLDDPRARPEEDLGTGAVGELAPRHFVFQTIQFFPAQGMD
jgi:hypothetical protein